MDTTSRLNLPYTTTKHYFSKIRGKITYYYELEYGNQTETDIVMWLHGSGYNTLRQLEIAGNAYLKAAIGRENKSRGLRLIMPVCPPDVFWLNIGEKEMRIEDYVTKELIPAVLGEKNGEKKTIQLHGYSMGGYGALRIGLKNSNIFEKIIAIAAGPLSENIMDGRKGSKETKEKIYRTVFKGSMNRYKRCSPYSIASNELSEIKRNKLKILLVSGSRDECKEENEALSERLKAMEIGTEHEILDGVEHRLDHYMKHMEGKLLI